MKVLFVFEFGLLHYRIPILEKIALSENIDQCDIIHTGKHTNGNYKFVELKADVKSFSSFKLISNVKSLIHNYDVVVYSANLWRPSWLYSLFSGGKAKNILWGHGFGKDKNFLIARIVKIWLAKWADAHIFYTDNGAEDYRKNGIPENKLFVAKNTLHIENSGRSDESHKTDLIYVGRIQERKGIDLLIKAFLIIKNDIPADIKVRIIGDGNISKYKQLVENYQLNNRILFEPGIYDNEKLKDTFNNAIAYVSPNHVGLGVVHSFAYGLPVITDKTKKHAPEFEYCDDTNSLLYEGGVENLALELKKICNDKELQRKLSIGGYNYYNTNLKSDIMVQGFLDAFNFVLKRKIVKRKSLYKISDSI